MQVFGYEEVGSGRLLDRQERLRLWLTVYVGLFALLLGVSGWLLWFNQSIVSELL